MPLIIEEPSILRIRRGFPRPTAEQIEALRGIPTGFVCDVMGGQGAVSSQTRPIDGAHDMPCNAVGPALVATTDQPRSLHHGRFA